MVNIICVCCNFVYSALLGDIEDADDAITTADSEHLATVAEIGREASS